MAAVLFVVFALVPAVSAQHDDSTGLEASQAALTLHRVPRFGKPDALPNFLAFVDDEDADTSAFQDDLTEYGLGVIASAVIGVVFAVLTFLICCGFCLGRSCCKICCNNCGGRDPKPEGYTKKHKTIVFSVLLVATVLVTIFCAIGYQGNAKFSDSIAGSEGLLILFGQFFADLEAFFTTRLEEGPIEAVNNFIETSLDTLDDALEDVARVQDSRDQLSADLLDVAERFDNFSLTGTDNITGVNYTFVCDYCATVSDQVSEIEQQLSDETDGTFADIATLRDEANETISSLGDEVRDQISSVRADFQDVIDTQDEAQEELQTYLDRAEDIDKQRSLAYVILFVLPLPIIFMISIGVIVKSPLCFQLTCILSFAIMVLFWLLFAVHLPLGVVLSDACLLLDEQEQNVTEMFGPTVGPIMLACLQATPLTEVYDLDDVLPNAEDFDFGELDGLNTTFDFGEISELIDNATTLGTDQFFGILDSALENLNVYTEDPLELDPIETYTRENLTDLNTTELFPGLTVTDGIVDPNSIGVESFNESDPGIRFCDDENVTISNPPLDDIVIPFNVTVCGEFVVSLLTAQAIFRAEVASTPAFNAALDDFRDSTIQVNASAAQLTSDAELAVARLATIQNDLQTQLFDEVDQLVDNLNCDFVGQLYRDVKTGLCEEVLSAIILMVQALFFIPLFSIAVSITAIMCWKRVDADGDGTRFDNAGAKVSNYDDDNNFDDYGPEKVQPSPYLSSDNVQMAGNVSRTQSAVHPVNNRTELRYSIDSEDVATNPRGQSIAGASEHSRSAADSYSDVDTEEQSYNYAPKGASAPPEFDDTPQKP